MFLPIYIYGQPVLREVAQDITPDYPELPTLIENMYETMEKSDGVGLAAPQVGLSIRLLVVGLDVLSEDYPEYAGFKRAYLNAHIVETEEETVSMEEGCLSLPGINEPVRRPKRVRVQWMDPDFTQHDEWVDWIPGACFATRKSTTSTASSSSTVFPLCAVNSLRKNFRTCSAVNSVAVTR